MGVAALPGPVRSGGRGIPHRSTRASCTGCSRSRLAACAPRTDGGADRGRSRRATTRASSSAADPAHSRCRTRSGGTGIDHAVISADPSPGGMFRRWPHFQRLLSWTKPYAPVERGTRAYERYDWNSLLADEPEATRHPAGPHGRLVLLPVAAGDGGQPRGVRGQGRDRRPLRLRAGPARAARDGPDGADLHRRDHRRGLHAAGCWSSRSASPSRSRRRAPGWSSAITTRTSARPRRTPAGASSSSASRTRASSWPTACCRGPASSCSCRRRTPSCRWTPGRWSASGRATSSRTRTTSWAAASAILDAALDRVERSEDGVLHVVAAADGRRRRTWSSRSTTSSPRPAS